LLRRDEGVPQSIPGKAHEPACNSLGPVCQHKSHSARTWGAPTSKPPRLSLQSPRVLSDTTGERFLSSVVSHLRMPYSSPTVSQGLPAR
jgi:hypothetical protein